MFRLEDKQLHIIAAMILVSAALLFGIFGARRANSVTGTPRFTDVSDFSEGWVATYKTNDAAKIDDFYNGNIELKHKEYTITETVTFPDKLPVMRGQKVTFSHIAPEFNDEDRFLLITTNGLKVKVTLGEDDVYLSDDVDNDVHAIHLIRVPIAHSMDDIKIEYSGNTGKNVEYNNVYLGTYAEIFAALAKKDGIFIIFGFIFALIGIVLLVVRFLSHNIWHNLKSLTYSSILSILLGILFISKSRVTMLVSGINNGMYLIRVCLMVLSLVFYLLLIRSMAAKKRIMSLTDIGILVALVYYISIAVFQGFSFVTYETLDFVTLIVCAVFVFVYTIIMIVAYKKYDRKEVLPILYATVPLFACLVMQGVAFYMGKVGGIHYIYSLLGIFLYMVIMWIASVKKALDMKVVEEELPCDEEAVKNRIIDRVNPNLIFAAFQSLQKMIKAGQSEESTKLIYYTSVYFRDNLKAIDQAGEIVSFEDELSHIIAYLQLQKTRNRNFNFAVECKVKDFKVLRYFIEPIVENAVKYGIAGNGNKGNVAIRTYMRAEGYAIQVIDDGIGFDVKKLKKKSSTSLLNLFEKLENECQAKTEIISKEGKGTVVTIIFPMLENDLLDEVEGGEEDGDR